MSAIEWISGEVFTSAVASFTLSNIPQTYTDLILNTSILRTAQPNNAFLQYNGDTSSLYSYSYVDGNGSAAASGRVTGNFRIAFDYSTSTTAAALSQTHIMNYANTVTFKTLVNVAGAAGTNVVAHAGLWRSTAAISSITIVLGSGNIAAGSVISLWGVR